MSADAERIVRNHYADVECYPREAGGALDCDGEFQVWYGSAYLGGGESVADAWAAAVDTLVASGILEPPWPRRPDPYDERPGSMPDSSDDFEAERSTQ